MKRKVKSETHSRSTSSGKHHTELLLECGHYKDVYGWYPKVYKQVDCKECDKEKTPLPPVPPMIFYKGELEQALESMKRGGKRKGAGRKRSPERKKRYNVYLTDETVTLLKTKDKSLSKAIEISAKTASE